MKDDRQQRKGAGVMAVFTDMNLTMFWLIVLVALVVIELLTMGLTTVWFAGGALIATIAAVFHTPFFLQVILFLAVSAVLLIFTRPLAVKYFADDQMQNVPAIMAANVLMLLPIIIAFVSCQKFFVNSLVSSGLKG